MEIKQPLELAERFIKYIQETRKTRYQVVSFASIGNMYLPSKDTREITYAFSCGHHAAVVHFDLTRAVPLENLSEYAQRYSNPVPFKLTNASRVQDVAANLGSLLESNPSIRILPGRQIPASNLLAIQIYTPLPFPAADHAIRLIDEGEVQTIIQAAQDQILKGEPHTLEMHFLCRTMGLRLTNRPVSNCRPTDLLAPGYTNPTRQEASLVDKHISSLVFPYAFPITGPSIDNVQDKLLGAQWATQEAEFWRQGLQEVRQGLIDLESIWRRAGRKNQQGRPVNGAEAWTEGK